jgi:hypothetical protein
VRGLSTLQRHVSVRFQNISSHLKKETHEMNSIDEDESVQFKDQDDESKVNFRFLFFFEEEINDFNLEKRRNETR